MSTPTKTGRTTVPDIRDRKGGEPIVCLTAYSAPMARLLDPHVDLLLIGDSLAMVLYGMPNTLGVTLDTMIVHTQAVVRGSARACVIIDMPFGTYQESPQAAFRSAARAMAEGGPSGVKLEGGREMAGTIEFLVRRGIPVMGHVGLEPQSVNAAGGFRTRGKDAEDAEAILSDAKAVAEAGAFSMVIEGVVEPLARRITETVPIPTIGIGASPACDGQILVSDDLLGMFTDFTPRFVKQYADLGSEVGKAATAYSADVKARHFPGPEHCYGTK